MCVYILLLATYNDSFEFDDVVMVDSFIHVEDELCQLRHVMSCVALPRNVKISLVVLRKPLQPVSEEPVVVGRRGAVTVRLSIGGGVGVGESDTSRRFQKQHVCN